ncbi:MAG: hypothetical protein IPI67_28345 [Myxococcales bacterium]|nr:hypothetical protein [Myxococcales bacterium]
MADLEREFSGVIQPLKFSRNDQGFRLDMWILSNCQLLERQLEVTPDGMVDRRDTVRAADIPFYEGLMWGEHDGVLVPIE